MLLVLFIWLDSVNRVKVNADLVNTEKQISTTAMMKEIPKESWSTGVHNAYSINLDCKFPISFLGGFSLDSMPKRGGRKIPAKKGIGMDKRPQREEN